MQGIVLDIVLTETSRHQLKQGERRTLMFGGSIINSRIIVLLGVTVCDEGFTSFCVSKLTV